MILFDTETTGLIGHDHIPIEEQPEIIEFAGVKLHDETLEQIGELQLTIKPKRLPLPDKVVEITGITEDMLVNAPSFARVLPQIEQFFLGEQILVAHNAPYDVGMLRLELQRVDRLTRFPWPQQHWCTVAMTTELRGARMRLGDLYTELTGKQPEGWHRAMNDVMMLVDIVRAMKEKEML